MDKERKTQIDWCLDNETNDPETQEWRDELTPEEQEYIPPSRREPDPQQSIFKPAPSGGKTPFGEEENRP